MLNFPQWYVPRSLWWFALTALVYGLQLFPLTGIFLMMFAAPVWSVVTINAGFIGIVIEVVRRKTGPVWLAAPILWFVGYGALAAMNHMDARALDGQITAANATQSLAFSPQTSALLFTPWDGAPQGFLETYDLPELYIVTGREAAPYRLERMAAGEICLRIARDRSFSEADVRAKLFRRDGKLVRGACIYSAPQAPRLPVVAVQTGSTFVESAWLPYSRNQATVSDGSGRSITVTSGVAHVLSWFPMPVLGCSLNSSNPSWDCMAEFLRARRPLGAAGKTDGEAEGAVLAQALGLPKRSDRNGAPAAVASAEDTQRVTQIAAQRVDASLANLDRMLAGSKDPADYHVDGLANRPDLLGPRAERLAAALEASMDSPQTLPQARIYQGLLAGLSEADFARVGPAVLRIYTAHAGEARNLFERSLIERLGEVGAPALPLLQQGAFSKPHWEGAVAGLCHMGAPAAGLADALANLAATKGDMDDRQAAFIALLRLGRTDLADKVLAKGATPRHYKELRARITPASPPSTCDGRRPQA